MGQTTLGDSHLRRKNIYGLVDMSLAWLSSERLYQQLTESDTDIYSHPLESGHGSLCRVRGRNEGAVGKPLP